MTRPSVVAALVIPVCAGTVGCEGLGGLSGGEVSEAGGGADAGVFLPDGAASSCDPGPVTAGLVGYWPLDESAGTDVVDCSGHGHHGVLVGAAGAARVVGKKGGALAFDGASTCVIIRAPVEFASTGPLTAAAWVNVTRYPDTQSSFNIVSKTADSNENGWRLAADTGAVFNFKLGAADGSPWSIAAGSQPTGVFRHVAAVFEPGVAARLFVDGVAVDEDTAGVPARVVPTTADVHIGCRLGGNYFPGTIDEVKIFDRALPAVEIAMLAQ